MGKQRRAGSEADAAFVLLRRLPVDLVDEPNDLDRAFELSRCYDENPVHDLVYVAGCRALGEQLVPADEALLARLGSLAFVVGPS